MFCRPYCESEKRGACEYKENREATDSRRVMNPTSMCLLSVFFFLIVVPLKRDWAGDCELG